MEIDTGAAVSLISDKTRRCLFPDAVVQPSHASLRTYSGEVIPVVGQLTVDVLHNTQHASLPLVVVEGEGPTLLGRNWLSRIRLDWKTIGSVGRKTLSTVLENNRGVFEEGLGTLQGYEAQISVDPDVPPRFCKARSVPYALRTRIEQELERLQQQGIIEPVHFADWAAPIVPVVKKD